MAAHRLCLKHRAACTDQAAGRGGLTYACQLCCAVWAPAHILNCLLMPFKPVKCLQPRASTGGAAAAAAASCCQAGAVRL